MKFKAFHPGEEPGTGYFDAVTVQAAKIRAVKMLGTNKPITLVEYDDGLCGYVPTGQVWAKLPGKPWQTGET